MKYKKKPVVIDAVQWTGENHREMFDFLTENAFDKESMKVSGEHFYIDHNKVEGGLVIKTLEGEHLASIGDFIIRGVKGEYYPCKPDIFEQTYEKVEDTHIWTTSEWWKGNGTVTISNDDFVPYNTICPCNPANGGSGVCGCTMANQMVKKGGRIITSTSTANIGSDNPPKVEIKKGFGEL
jgi:hypothetical protein